MNHYYQLQKYAGKSTRHKCPNCGDNHSLTRYVDPSGKYLADNVGRCNHESSCAYHYSPKDYFRDHPDLKPSGHNWRELTAEEKMRVQPAAKPRSICYIPRAIVDKSFRSDQNSDLTAYLSTFIDPLVLEGVINDYRLGVTKDRDTIFFQIDIEGRCRTGKIMKYDCTTGHRIKDANEPNRITWVHSIMKHNNELPENWELTQCLFGEHLLASFPDKRVALVEAEKTAVICAAMMPSFVWLATGGKSQFNDRLKVLQGRKVVAFPDLDGYDLWASKARQYPNLDITVSNILVKEAERKTLPEGMDIADWIVQYKRHNNQ